VSKSERKVPPGLGGKRLDEVLVRLFDTGTRERSAALVRQGRVALDGKRVWREDTRVPSGARLALAGAAKPAAVSAGVASTPAVEWVHVDESLVVLDKPAGLLVQPTAKHPRGTVANLLLERFGPIADAPKGERAGLVHRLDRETSGLLAAARTRAAQEQLVLEFRERRVEKRYLALVHGAPSTGAFEIDLNLAPSADQSDVQHVDARGQPALTAFRVLERFPRAGGDGRALLECRPHTGRRHQIRVHLLAAGHPIVGDKIYRPASRGAPAREIGRHALHAAGLVLRHPVGGRPMTFESALPADLRTLLERWREGE